MTWMRQRKVLNDNEWTRRLKWMRNCFRYGTIGEQWQQIESERWFNLDFENFSNEEIIPEVLSSNARHFATERITTG